MVALGTGFRWKESCRSLKAGGVEVNYNAGSGTAEISLTESTEGKNARATESIKKPL